MYCDLNFPIDEIPAIYNLLSIKIMFSDLSSSYVPSQQGRQEKKLSTPISISSVTYKLREMEDRIMATKSRMQAMLIKQEKMQWKMKQEKRWQMNKSMMQGYKKQKKQAKNKLSFCIKTKIEKQRDRINNTRFEQKSKIQEIKQDIKGNNKIMYLTYKKQSEEWGKTIEKNRRRTLQQKQIKRKEVAQAEERSRVVIKQKIDQKISKTRWDKNEELRQIAETIQKREKVLEHLENVASVKKMEIYSHDNINPEELVRRLSTLHSDLNQSQLRGRKIKHKRVVSMDKEEKSYGQVPTNVQSRDQEGEPMKEVRVVMYGSHGKTVIYDPSK